MTTHSGARVPARPGGTAVFLGLAAALLAAAAHAAGPRQAVEQRVYVGVVDERGTPVTDLTAADFLVREDGVSREVLRAGRATDPMQIAVLVDDTQAAARAILDERRGLQAFVAALHEGNEIALVTFADRPTVVADYTAALPKLKAGIDRVFSRPGSGSYLLEAIMEATRDLRKRDAMRPVIVALTTDGDEFSNDYYVTVVEALRRSRAQLHAIIRTAGGDAAGSLASDAVRNRNLALADGTAQTGGRRDYILSDSAFATALSELASELKNQYLLVYARPQTLIPPERLEVSVRRPGATARARTVAGTP